MVKTCYIKGVHRVKENICSKMFYKVVALESVLQNSQENVCVGVTLNKVVGMKRVHHKYFPMKYFPLKTK